MLASYITDVQNLLNDAGGQMFPLPTLTRYINKSRRRIAAVSGCLRCVPAGVYTVPWQEVYPFADWIALVQGVNPQYQSILACRSVAVAIGGQWQRDGQITRGGWKPVWKRVIWTDFQARFRIYNGSFIGTISEPGWWAQYGEGPIGSIYLSPIPGQKNPMEVDLTCIPFPLLTDNDACPIPYPWNDAVPYWAATLCLIQQQRTQDATAMAATFSAELPLCAAVVCPQMIQNVYGATLRSA